MSRSRNAGRSSRRIPQAITVATPAFDGDNERVFRALSDAANDLIHMIDDARVTIHDAHEAECVLRLIKARTALAIYIDTVNDMRTLREGPL